MLTGEWNNLNLTIIAFNSFHVISFPHRIYVPTFYISKRVSESSVQPKEDKKVVDVVEKFPPPEVTTKGRKDKNKASNKKAGPLYGTRKSSKQRELSPDAKVSSEAKNANHQPVRRIRKKQQKVGIAKVRQMQLIICQKFIYSTIGSQLYCLKCYILIMANFFSPLQNPKDEENEDTCPTESPVQQVP